MAVTVVVEDAEESAAVDELVTVLVEVETVEVETVEVVAVEVAAVEVVTVEVTVAVEVVTEVVVEGVELGFFDSQSDHAVLLSLCALFVFFPPSPKDFLASRLVLVDTTTSSVVLGFALTAVEVERIATTVW